MFEIITRKEYWDWLDELAPAWRLAADRPGVLLRVRPNALEAGARGRVGPAATAGYL